MTVHHERVEEGLFVYQIIRSDRVRIRSNPEVDGDVEDDTNNNEGGNFEENELLSVDMVQPTSNATFVRLADQSGWVVADEKGEVYMRQIPVETGLFSFYVDNFPSGIVVRRHPMDDSSELLTTEADDTFQLEPMQRIYCDAVTQHPLTGVKFYRLQCGGNDAPATPGWVYDRKPAAHKTRSDKHYLLDANKVKTGTFAYKAVCGAIVRHAPNCSESSKTSHSVDAGEIVVVDVIRESPYSNGNGPFLRLADGTGWLFERKLNEQAMMPVPMKSGKWTFSILNDPVGMMLRKQPVDSQVKVYDTVFKSGELAECDRMVSNSAGVNFYRVYGTKGWLFDKRNGVPLLNLLSTSAPDSNDEENVINQPSWDPNFVRGIAATIKGAKELPFQKAGQIVSFDTADGVQVKVFCLTRTICSIFEHSSKGTVKNFLRNCTPQDVSSALEMDLIESILDYDKFEGHEVEATEAYGGEEKKGGDAPLRSPLVQQEETLRIRLLVCEAEITASQAKRRDLLASIKEFDDKRAKEAARMKEDTERCRGGTLAFDHPPTRPEQKKAEGAAIANYPQRRGRKEDRAFESSRSSYSESTDDWSTCSEGVAAASSRISRASSGKGATKQAHVCGECFRSFTGRYSRDSHCREVHKIVCATCDKVFSSFKALEVHRNTAKH